MPVVKSIVKALRSASKGLLYTSESDAKLTALAWSAEQTGGAKTPLEAVAKVAGVSSSEVKSVSLENFFDPMATPQDWWGEDEKETGTRFQELKKTLASLEDSAAFRVGDGPDIDVYIVGRDPGDSGGYSGVKTRVTET